MHTLLFYFKFLKVQKWENQKGIKDGVPVFCGCICSTTKYRSSWEVLCRHYGGVLPKYKLLLSSGPVSPFHQDIAFIKCHLEDDKTSWYLKKPASLYRNYFFLVLFCNLKKVCLIATGFVQSNSTLLWLKLHSQQSCTSSKATAVCSTHPPPGCNSHTYRMHARKGPHLRYTFWLSTTAKKWN